MLFRKTILTVITTAMMCSAAMASDAHDHQTMSLGYQYGHIQDYGDIQGGNFKFQYETSTPFGVMGSLTAMKNNWRDENTTCKRVDDKCRRIYKETHKLDRNAEYYSAMIGPTYRIADSVSVFALAGISHTKVDRPVSLGPDNNLHQKNGSESSNQFAYGTGITINATKNLAITIGYEGSQAAFSKRKHQMSSAFVDVGYRF